MTITKRIFLILIVLIACVGSDQTTKSIAETCLTENEAWSFWGDTVRLQLAHNSGAFLSLGATMPDAWREGIFSIGTGGLLLALLGYTLFYKSASTLEILAFSLLLSGGISNLIDRVLFGYVVDFMNIGIGLLRTGIFNVADIAVSLGVFILIADGFHKRSKNL
jgi:signal peptidase II